MDHSTYREATTVAQKLLRDAMPGGVLYDGRRMIHFKADGKWGRVTQSAYNQADHRTRLAVDNILRDRYNTSAFELSNIRRAQKIAAENASFGNERDGGLKRYWDLDSIQAMIRRHAVPEYAELLADERIINLEAARGPGLTYDAFSKAKTSSASGLFQLTKGTWANVANAAGVQNVSPWSTTMAPPRVVGGPFDAEANVKAYVELGLRNIMALKKARLPITYETVYAMHQQGSPARIKAGSWAAANQQSGASLAILDRAHKQAIGLA